MLTDPKLIKGYLHGTDAQTDWQVGSPIAWRGEWKGTSYEDKGTILVFEPPRRLSMTHWSPMTGEEDTPENYHVVTYELEPGIDEVNLTLIQGQCPSQEVADGMVKGWKAILEVLKEQAEK